MILYQFELALTPPSILFSLRTLGNFPAFLRICMVLIFSTKLPVLLCVHLRISQVYETKVNHGIKYQPAITT